MDTKKIWNKPELYLISAGYVEAKLATAANEGSYVGQTPNNNPAIHTITFDNTTIQAVPVAVTSKNYIS